MTRTQCRWCTGEVVRDEERNATGHSDPVCRGFMDMIRQSSGFDRMSIDLIDDDNKLVESFPTTTRPRVTGNDE